MSVHASSASSVESLKHSNVENPRISKHSKTFHIVVHVDTTVVVSVARVVACEIDIWGWLVECNAKKCTVQELHGTYSHFVRSTGSFNTLWHVYPTRKKERHQAALQILWVGFALVKQYLNSRNAVSFVHENSPKIAFLKATCHDICHVDNPITTSKWLLKVKHPRHTPGTHGVEMGVDGYEVVINRNIW